MIDRDPLPQLGRMQWHSKGLPVPRLELSWKRTPATSGDDDSEMSYSCTYLIVTYHQHPTLDAVVAMPLGKVYLSASEMNMIKMTLTDHNHECPENRHLTAVPFRDFAHALSDSVQMGLPLYVTNEANQGPVLIEADGSQIKATIGEKKPVAARNKDDRPDVAKDWSDKGLPVPRLELYWETDNGDHICSYVLVYRHLIHRVENPKILAKMMGFTRVYPGGRSYFTEYYGEQVISVPFRDWAHALSDATQLNLPLFITTINNDVATAVPTSAKGNAQQRMLRIAGKDLVPPVKV